MAVRPRPAASLVLIWRNEVGEPHVFMGRRHPNLKFLPNVLVFPGGRVEKRDEPYQALLARACESALDGERSKQKAGAFAAAALRECSEETGLELNPTQVISLQYIARAITPPHQPIRYDTRFFLKSLSSQSAPMPQNAGDGELLSPGWYTRDAVAQENVHHVTRAVLDHALRVSSNSALQMQRLLVADRMPHNWHGLPPLRSAALRMANS
jgi:8-oxo-dGTP pyrophosphatase MutT (NUDIX family)